MTIFTNRDYVKPMLRCITGMMVFFCLLWAIMALQSIGARHFASSNGVVHGISSFQLFWMMGIKAFFADFSIIFTLFSFPVTNLASPVSNFAFLCLPILPTVHFTVFCLSVFFPIVQKTDFTMRFVSILFSAIFVKFGQWLGFLAFRTSFCYDLLRHDFLLTRKLCLEPNTRPVLVSGSFYYR